MTREWEYNLQEIKGKCEKEKIPGNYVADPEIFSLISNPCLFRLLQNPSRFYPKFLMLVPADSGHFTFIGIRYAGF